MNCACGNPDCDAPRKLQGPCPVGQKRLRTLKALRAADRPWNEATAQFGALYRMGYVRRVENTAQITNAGLAALDRQEQAHDS